MYSKTGEKINNDKNDILSLKIKRTKYISILNKINHKPLLLNSIFPFVSQRPYILPCILDQDFLLKNKLKTSIGKIKKNNSLENKEIIYKFISYKLLYNMQLDENLISRINNNKKNSMFHYYNKYIIENSKNLVIPNTIKIPRKIVEKNMPNESDFFSFTKDYFSQIKELSLFYFPKNEINNDNYDIEYLYNLNFMENKTQKINLICLISNENYNSDSMIITYKYINKIIFIIDESYKYENNLYYKVNNFLKGIKNKNNIKQIIFDESFSKKISNYEKQNILINNKIYLEYMFNDYFSNLKEQENLFSSLYSLEKIIFDDKNLINDIQRLKLRFNLNKICSEKVWNKIIIITPKDFENVYNLKDEEKRKLRHKLKSFKREETDLKILYLNFEGHSPYQKNFILFCKNYLNIQKYINIVIINNIGKINLDVNCYNKIKNKERDNLIHFPNIKKIFYEDLDDKSLYDNNINESFTNGKDIKEFIDLFFDKNELILNEGFDIDNKLKYINISNRIYIDELERLFILNNKIIKLNIYYKNVIIAFNKNNYSVRIQNNMKNPLYNNHKIYINTLIEAFNNLNLLKKNLTSDKKLLEELSNDELPIMKIDDYNGPYFDSKILIKKYYFDSLFKVFNLLQKSKYEFKLIYRASTNSGDIKELTFLCRNLNKMLLIVKTHKGNIFGALKNFKDTNTDNIDKEDKGFVFDIINDKIYFDDYSGYLKDDKIGVYKYFCLSKNFFSKNNKIIKGSMNIEENYFSCKEVEIFLMKDISSFI